MNDIPSLFHFLDEEWLKITPDAVKIRSWLAQRSEVFRNDHVAFRTFDDPRINASTLAAPFVDAGYTQSGTYVFEEKALNALSLRPPPGDVDLPHVFISELDSARIPASLADDVATVLSSLDTRATSATGDLVERGYKLLRGDFSWSPPSLALYRKMSEASEYAGWLAAFGIRANHFTVDVNALKTLDHVSDVNAWLLAKDIRLNGRAPFIQGGPHVLLAQSSTVANLIPWKFANDVTHSIPSCYVEFAERFHDDTGHLFDEFVATSADKIFESTQESTRESTQAS